MPESTEQGPPDGRYTPEDDPGDTDGDLQIYRGLDELVFLALVQGNAGVLTAHRSVGGPALRACLADLWFIARLACEVKPPSPSLDPHLFDKPDDDVATPRGPEGSEDARAAGEPKPLGDLYAGAACRFRRHSLGGGSTLEIGYVIQVVDKNWARVQFQGFDRSLAEPGDVLRVHVHDLYEPEGADKIDPRELAEPDVYPMPKA